jgi:hypothetical protein
MPATQAESSAITTLGRYPGYCPLPNWDGLSHESEAVIPADRARQAAESSRREVVKVDSGYHV